VNRIGELFLPRGRVMRQGLNETLRRIKTVAEPKVATTHDSDSAPQ